MTEHTDALGPREGEIVLCCDHLPEHPVSHWYRMPVTLHEPVKAHMPMVELCPECNVRVEYGEAHAADEEGDVDIAVTVAIILRLVTGYYTYDGEELH